MHLVSICRRGGHGRIYGRRRGLELTADSREARPWKVHAMHTVILVKHALQDVVVLFPEGELAKSHDYVSRMIVTREP
jgi:hypothetical protein